MLIDREVNRYIEKAPAILAGNVASFLTENAIDRAELEEFALRPFKGGFDPFYVSTVARGLAGSKSDLDLLLLSDDPLSGSTTLSHMLFHAGRRIGIKLIDNNDMRDTLTILREVSERLAAGQFIVSASERKRVVIGWSELERLINGVSFASGARYIEFLPDLCRWMVIDTLQDFYRQISLARLALMSGNLSAASAYALGSIVAAMDAVMAACGHIQSNTKWTFERWQRFVPNLHENKAVEAATYVSEAHGLIAAPLVAGGANLAQALTKLQSYFRAEFVPPSQLGRLHFSLSAEFHRTPFLPGADSISSKTMAAVMDTSTLDQILDITSADRITCDSVVAADTLNLLRAGALSITLSPIGH